MVLSRPISFEICTMAPGINQAPSEMQSYGFVQGLMIQKDQWKTDASTKYFHRSTITQVTQRRLLAGQIFDDFSG